jgi:hypothetical protein
MNLIDRTQYDVIILGNHAATYLAGILLRQHSEKLRVLHVPLSYAHAPDRLVLINPDFFRLHPGLSSLQRKLDLTGVYGVCFLADDLQTHSEYRGKTAMSCVGKMSEITQALRQLAGQADVVLADECDPKIAPPDEAGVSLDAGNLRVRAKALLVGDRLDKASERTVALEPTWERDVLHLLSFSSIETLVPAKLGVKKILPLSLDLSGSLAWGYFIPSGENAQPFVLRPVDGPHRQQPTELLRHWIHILEQNDCLRSTASVPETAAVQSIEIPLAGALGNEGVGDRAMAIGPAGGFFAATGEDLYPNCWSAVFAVEVLTAALREKHLQDALQEFRQNWRIPLGEYLRGPQQDLRLLLPLIYRNRVIAARFAESILQGKNVVRPEASDNESVP